MGYITNKHIQLAKIIQNVAEVHSCRLYRPAAAAASAMPTQQVSFREVGEREGAGVISRDEESDQDGKWGYFSTKRSHVPMLEWIISYTTPVGSDD